jgi:hypothetical protein
MRFVFNRHFKRISKHCAGLLERDTMFGDISRCFVRVPFNRYAMADPLSPAHGQGG